MSAGVYSAGKYMKRFGKKKEKAMSDHKKANEPPVIHMDIFPVGPDEERLTVHVFGKCYGPDDFRQFPMGSIPKGLVPWLRERVNAVLARYYEKGDDHVTQEDTP
jgi:hypothetical protein